MWSTIKKHYALVSIVLFYLALFLPAIGSVHLFDWDEINFAEAAREMLVTGDWINVQINYQPFWEKPPLFIWLQAASMRLFGVTEFAARFPNVIVGLVTIFALYIPVYKRYSKQAAVFTVMLYIGSLTPHFYFKSGIIDPLFNLFIYLGVLQLVKSVEKPSQRTFFLSGVFLGLAVVTKGPVALLLVGLAGLFYQLVYRVHFYSFKNLLMLSLGLFSVLGLVFGFQVYENGFWFLQEFTKYQIDLFREPIASHGQPFYYHFVVLLIGCFPLFILAFGQLTKRTSTSGDVTFLRWMKVLFWVVLIIFSMVTTKIVHYSSMCYIPLAIVGGVWMSNFKRVGVGVRIAFTLVGLLWAIIFLIACALSINAVVVLEAIVPYVNDNVAIAKMQSSVTWSSVSILVLVLYLTVFIPLVWRPNKLRLASLLITNTLVITLFMSSFVPSVEQVVQGSWIKHLETYQGKEVSHFTYGFKSYAHRFYTQEHNFNEIQEARAFFKKEQGLEKFTDLNQYDKKMFDNAFRDYVIRETSIPVSVSCKINKNESLASNYPELHKVFEGNGYAVWERKKPNKL